MRNVLGEEGELAIANSEEALEKSSDEALSSDYTNKANLSRSDRLQFDSILAEFAEEEQYYSGEPDYLDDTHDWSDDGDEFVSDDYWHFLGLYE